MEVQTYEALFDHLTQLGPRRPHLRWIEHTHITERFGGRGKELPTQQSGARTWGGEQPVGDAV